MKLFYINIKKLFKKMNKNDLEILIIYKIILFDII